VHHRQKRVLVAGIVGIALIFAAIAVGHHSYWEAALMVLAGALLSFAHLSNLRSCRMATAKK
jgi:hypothetical protein